MRGPIRGRDCSKIPLGENGFVVDVSFTNALLFDGNEFRLGLIEIGDDDKSAICSMELNLG